MNTRIKELHNQACRFDMEHYPNAIPDGERIQQKFAELIVTECLRQVEEQYKPVLEDEVMMKDTHWGGYVQCGVDSYVAIREHFFGVEE
jgi:hypothetical protein